MIYRLAEPGDWADALSKGEFKSADLGLEGFIHCASRSQVPGVARRYYAGRDGITIVAIDEGRLGNATLVWENTTGGVELFPHVRGPIPLAAVVAHAPLALSADGEMT